MKKAAVALLSVVALVCAGCGKAAPAPTSTAHLPDPPEDEWLYELPIYWAWNMMPEAKEGWDYTFSREGVVEEGRRDAPATGQEGDGVLEDLEAPGGRTVYFRGVAPGDVVITFTTKQNGKKVLDVNHYTVRVYEDLRLALLDTEHHSYR